jgi:hypothetical protein
MSEDEKFILSEFPKNGRIDNYTQECTQIIKEKNAKRLEQFMMKVLNDCLKYLREKFNLSFPNMQVQIIYNQKEYAELLTKLDERFGARPYTKAVCVSNKYASCFYINFLDHFKGKPSEFVVNLCLSYIEELIHSAYPSKSETQIHEITCSAVEGFIEMKLPDNLKEARLKYAQEFDELSKNSPTY